MMGAALSLASSAIPLDPDSEEARRAILDELAKPEYEAARPTWFDRIAGTIWDWFRSLDFSGVPGSPVIGIAIVLAVVIAALIIAFLVFGVPRLQRRSALTGELFGREDARTSAALREAAETLARRGDFASAIAEMFRAIARGLSERTVVSTSPGTTARDFAARATTEFPAFDVDLADAARAFDGVRYLGRPGDSASFDAVAALERQLRITAPRLEGVPV